MGKDGEGWGSPGALSHHETMCEGVLVTGWVHMVRDIVSHSSPGQLWGLSLWNCL